MEKLVKTYRRLRGNGRNLGGIWVEEILFGGDFLGLFRPFRVEEGYIYTPQGVGRSPDVGVVYIHGIVIQV
jgi:hypothetical protein